MTHALAIEQTQSLIIFQRTLEHFWELDESTGATATDDENGENGTYTGDVTLARYVSLDDKPAPGFPGDTSSSYVLLPHASITFDGDEGSISFLYQPATVWNDGTSRYLFEFYTDSFNRMYAVRSADGSISFVRFVYTGGGTVSSAARTGTKPAVITFTWSQSANELSVTVDGTTTTSTAGNAWVGGLTAAIIGKRTTDGSCANGSIASFALFSAALDSDAITALYHSTLWRRSYHNTARFWMLAPQPIFQARISGGVTTPTGAGDIIHYIPTQAPTLGALADLKEGMTILFGSTTDGEDLGRARVIGVTNIEGTDYIEVWASAGTHDGELFPTYSPYNYVTVLDDYRIWGKPPYAYDGDYWFDGERGPQGITYEQPPQANCGKPILGDVDIDTGVMTVNLSASESFATALDGILGGLTSDLLDGTETAAASSGSATLANISDNNTGTAWAPSSKLNQWVRWYWPNYAPKHIRKFDVTGSGTTAPVNFTLQYSDDASHWVSAGTFFETSWGSPETRTFYIHDCGSHPYWRLFVHYSLGASLAVYEVALYEEDRTAGSSPWTWDVADGTITVGSTTTQDITVTFPVGYRWIELLVTDTNGEVGFNHIPIVACIPEGQSLYLEADKTSAVYTASTGTASYAFDGNPATTWNIGSPPAWVKIQYATSKNIKTYSIDCSTNAGIYTNWPTAWVLEGSNDDSLYTTVDSRSGIIWPYPTYTNSYTVSTPGDYLYYRLTITAANGSLAGIDVLTLNVEASQVQGLVESFQVRSHTADLVGQRLDVVIFDSMDRTTYPDGTFAIYEEREVFNGTAQTLVQAGPENRTNVKWWGWIHYEKVNITYQDVSLQTETVLQCFDKGNRLTKIAGQTIMVQRDGAPTTCLEYERPNMDAFINHILRWMSTANEIGEFYWSNSADHYSIGLLAAHGADIYSMADGRAQAIGFRLTCNKHGALKIKPDPMIAVNVFDSSIDTIESLTAYDYQSLSFTHQRPPRTHWYWASGISFSPPVDVDHGSFNANAWFSVAPGRAPGQGAGNSDQGEMLLSTAAVGSFYQSAELIERAKRLYRRANAPQSFFTIRLQHEGDNGIDPGELHWLLLTIDDDTKAERGLTFNEAYGVPFRITIEHDEMNLTKFVTIEWERLSPESSGAVTYNP
jgi:hypothetical protein